MQLPPYPASTSTEPTASGCAALLVRLAAGRDVEAWADLLRQVGSDIARVAQRVLGDASLADDAVQETLLRIRDHAGQFKPPPRSEREMNRAALGWILRVATTTSLNLLRQRQRQRVRAAADIADRNSQDDGPMRRIENEETSTIVRRQVAELPELNREAVTLHYFGGLSFDTLARELGVPLDTAKRRVHRGLYALRRNLERAGCALSLVALTGLLTEVGSAETQVAISARHLALLNSARTAGRLGLPAGAPVGVASWIGILAILATGTSVLAWWGLGTKAPPATSPPASPSIPLAAAAAPLPPGQRLDDPEEWIGDGRMEMVRYPGHVELSIRVPKGVIPQPQDHGALVSGSLRHRRIWKLDTSAVSLRLDVAVPEHASPVVFELGAMLADGTSTDWRRWPKLHVIYDGFGKYVNVPGTDIGSELGSLTTYIEREEDGAPSSSQRPLFGTMINLQPGRHRLELILSHDACWALADGQTVVRDDRIGTVPLAQFYFGAHSGYQGGTTTEVRVDAVELGPSDRLNPVF